LKTILPRHPDGGTKMLNSVFIARVGFGLVHSYPQTIISEAHPGHL